ncbi:uncharacterized protein LOC135961682 [Calliphora vicina]|uniref:uncharacterized protein LOC135961682 n=1 Tax=Calliphora vicina TaxID=7373 RepID=UPI00325C098C
MQSNQNKITAPCILCNKFALVILLLLHVHVSSVTAERTCHQCRGINCLRTTYEATQKCLNDLDICVTVFDGQTILAQGCLEQLSEELRNKCGGYAQSPDSEEFRECFKCNENLCNNLASSSFECIQCDSDSDENCRTNPLSLLPTRCGISRTPNEYCYVKQEGNRVIRGCSSTVEEQNTCLSNADCMICQPSELSGCNANDITLDGSGSGDEGTGSGSGNGGSDEGESGNGSSGEGGSGNESDNTAERICHQCRGINCLRTTYEATQKCLNDLDICVTVFDGQTILAQGCLEQLSEELRHKCDVDTTAQDFLALSECFKCNDNLCNNLASSSFECIQCDSESDANCRTNPQSLAPSRCGISRTPNEYCFVKQEGERMIRGCSNTLEEQISCLSSADCMICQPSELSGCNAMDVTIYDGDSGDGGSGNGSGNGGSDEGESGNGSGGEGGSGNESGNTAERICHQCRGINCLRTTYEATQKCLNDLDICVTVFDGQTILAQGCLEQLSEELRHKCDVDTTAQDSLSLSECFKCNDNLCNNLASSSFECIQCDSESDANCRTNPQSLAPSRCGISRTPNEYCFVKQEGERVIRGCSNTLEEQISCLSSVDCMICQPSELSGCNDIEVITNDGGSGSGSGDGSGNGGSDQGGSGSGSGNGGSDQGGSGSGSGNGGSDQGGSGSGSGGENTGDGGNSDSGNDAGDGGSGGGSGDGSSGSGDGGTGNGSDGSGTSGINSHIFIFIINIIIVFFVSN